MLEGSGGILHKGSLGMSSLTGRVGIFRTGHYGTSRTGLVGLTKITAVENVSKRITCNALAPRYVNTDMMNTYSANQVEALMALIPMVCFAEPKEPADAAPFLTSNASA